MDHPKVSVSIALLLLISSFPITLGAVADCEGTADSPCHMCDVDAMNIMIYNEYGEVIETNPMVHQDPDSGVCGVTPEVTETWTYDLAEGSDIRIEGHAEGDPWLWEVLYDSYYGIGGNLSVWVAGPNIFTIGKPTQVNVYVRNLGSETDNYRVNYTVYYTYQGDDLSHLIDVFIPSDSISSVQSNRVGVTQATLKILGPIRTSDARVKFNVTSDSTGEWRAATIMIKAGYPISLPEFKLIGLIQLLILSCLTLILSYRIGKTNDKIHNLELRIMERLSKIERKISKKNDNFLIVSNTSHFS